MPTVEQGRRRLPRGAAGCGARRPSPRSLELMTGTLGGKKGRDIEQELFPFFYIKTRQAAPV